MSALGQYIKEIRQNLSTKYSGYSIISLARRIGLHHYPKKGGRK